MLKHFPFSKTFDLKMGTTTLPADAPFIEVDEKYLPEVELKRKLLSEDHGYYYQSLGGDEQAQWEVLDLVLHQLGSHYPEAFSLEKHDHFWSFRNQKLNEEYDFIWGDSGSLPQGPLDWVGRQVQEDLLILNEKGELISGQLCFPSGWSLGEKLGKHFMSIHEPLPDRLTPMIEAAGKLMERIPQGRSIQRTNWGFRISDELDMSTRHGARYREMLKPTETWSEKDVADNVFVRIEYQTLHRLPSGMVLFTIHTHLSPIAEEVKDPARAGRMFEFLATVPLDVRNYKLITPYHAKLGQYLKNSME
ncbi:MAG: DUF3445 domain-containing protein [Cyclobacteriaceae bacterium]